MYLPAHFNVSEDAAAVDEIVRRYPLASLVLCGGPDQPLSVDPVVLSCAGPVATGSQLIGHIARANPLSSMLSGSSSTERAPVPLHVAAIFTGPRAYISPNWYPSKQVHHRVVPTYNYCTVVVHGRMYGIDAPAEKLKIVRELTVQMEGEGPDAWSVDDAPSDYIDHMLKAITGVRIEIDQVQAKFKISQNREPLDRGSVQLELESHFSQTDAQVMASLMERFQPN